ncbi:cytochrome-c oxidase, cbb3-type subunit II [Shumkonia mesophila]|uniref:cytochrome-c oxidase, cbb3-type subunit II n=1 Tax=Shumkonia mesophila TaxID=2838854 RepID=UPI0029352161|nr:cytochrome-c oxidase, cbb3-type subunit II [Shumkonia mesophila]
MNHKMFERNVVILAIAILITVSIGGLVQLVPLYTMEVTIEKVDGMRPYSPLELAGRNIYVREGCYLCHSQQIRPFRDEVERYGHYSLAAESMYDHPFQWGSKRTGPDLARVGGKYSNEWHVQHLAAPRSLVPESVMPGYAFLARNELHAGDIADHMKTLRVVGVPYADEQIANAKADLAAQAGAAAGDVEGLQERYAKAALGDFDGNPARVTEMDAVVAYLQMLGTLVDFTTFKPEYGRR